MLVWVLPGWKTQILEPEEILLSLCDIAYIYECLSKLESSL